MNQTSPFLIASSKLLERAGYYGLRAMLVIYMVGETLSMDRVDALVMYGYFTGLIFFFQIFGALVGDLVVGNKKAIIMGGVIQAIGAFCIAVPHIGFLYLGLFLVSLGGGLYTPNIIAQFGKEYLNKTKLMDSGFTLFYVCINIGAFLGILILSVAGETYGYHFGFIGAGVFMLLSIIPLLITKEPDPNFYKNNKISARQRINFIVFTIVTVGVFWTVYEMQGMYLYEWKGAFYDMLSIEMNQSIWNSVESYFTIILGFIAIFLWAFVYSSQLFKLLMCFIFGTVGLSLFYYIPASPLSSDFGFFVGGLLFFSVAEVFIAPVVNSVVTQFGNPKYLAILMSLTFLPGKIFFAFYVFLTDVHIILPESENIVGLIVLGFLTLILFIFYIQSKKKRVKDSELYLDR